jgi:predicted RNA-binding protein YlxR (DUF448 family)
VGCGTVAPKPELIRIALSRSAQPTGPVAVLDPENRMSGRGAYLCRAPGTAQPSAECLAAALRRGGIARTLRARVSLDPKLVESVGR